MLNKKLEKSLSTGFYYITPSSDCKVTAHLDIMDVTRAALEGGARIVQYREKVKPSIEVALRLKRLAHGYNAVFIVNDYPFLAREVQADGVHVGQDDACYENAREAVNDGIVGVSAGSIEGAIQAIMKGADYIGVGPIYRSTTKSDAKEPCGLEVVERVSELERPCVAIGGINFKNYSRVLEKGARAVCIISEVALRPDISNGVREIINGSRHLRGSMYMSLK